MTWRVFFLLLCLLPACSAWAQLYHCKTGRGTINYTNVPCLDKAPPKPVKREFIVGKTAQWVDPSRLTRPPEVAVIEPLQAPDRTNTPSPTVKAIKQVHGTTATVETSTITPSTNAQQDTTVFMNGQYQVGMRWLLRTSGTYVTYEQYEITHVENQIVGWTRTLLNANKEPFAGGLTETFTMDLRQQPVSSDQPTQLRLAGYVFDAYKHQTEQATSWHVSSLPLITPLVHYRSGDKTVMLEFTP